MAFRCGSCNKFRSLKDADVEVEVRDYEFDPDDGMIAKLNMGVTKLCPECGEAFAFAEVELEIEVPEAKWKATLDEAEWEQA